MSHPFAPGDLALLVDRKSRRYLVTLEPGTEFHTHTGVVAHDELLGAVEGSVVTSTQGARYTAVRPTLADFVLKMPRGAQVIYPKDLGPLLLLIDVFPGARILESGVGSGALSMTLLRAGADVVGYELRPDFVARARRNVAAFLGDGVLERYRVEERDAYEGIDERDLDRVVFDLPEPWRMVRHAAAALAAGGVFVAYTPSVVQVAQLQQALDRSPFGMSQTVEVLQRPWHVDGQAVRPNHRMVGHTGFLTQARLLEPAAVAPRER